MITIIIDGKPTVVEENTTITIKNGKVVKEEEPIYVRCIRGPYRNGIIYELGEGFDSVPKLWTRVIGPSLKGFTRILRPGMVKTNELGLGLGEQLTGPGQRSLHVIVRRKEMPEPGWQFLTNFDRKDIGKYARYAALFPTMVIVDRATYPGMTTVIPEYYSLWSTDGACPDPGFKVLFYLDRIWGTQLV